MKKAGRILRSVISILVIALLCTVSVSASEYEDDIFYGCFFVIVKADADVKSIIASIECDHIEFVRELTNPADYEEEYTPMLLVEVKKEDKESFEKALAYFADKEYVLSIKYEYLFPAPSPWFLPGDSDSDERITAADARTILRYTVGLINNNSLIFKEAIDISGDGNVTAEDARTALRVSVGLDKQPALRERKAY